MCEHLVPSGTLTLCGPVKCTYVSEGCAASVISVSHHLVYLSSI